VSENASASQPEQHTKPTRHALRATLIGGAAWFLALMACVHYRMERLTTILMPLWKPFATLAGPGFNIGTAEKPLYEGTPVQVIAYLAGIGLSVFVYIALAYILSRVLASAMQLRSRK
jgi:hypothetical protein